MTVLYFIRYCWRVQTLEWGRKAQREGGQDGKNRDYFIAAAHEFLTKTANYDKASEAKFRSYLRLADSAAASDASAQPKKRITYASSEERSAFLTFLRTGRAEFRDMGGGAGAFPGSLGSPLVPIAFRNEVVEQLKMVDQLWDDSLVTLIKTPKGSVFSLPLDSDVTNKAVVLSEGAHDGSPADLFMGLLPLPQCPTWRVSCFVSGEFWVDSAIPLDSYLAERFAVRFERGVGPAMVSTLLAGTAGTVVAAGAAASGQIGISTLIGSDDLFHLISSLEPSYFASPKCAWCMRPATYYAILSLRSNSTGSLIFPYEVDEAGHPMLLGRRVAFAPSMPGSSIILGDFSRFVLREAGDMLMSVSVEVRPERGQLFVRGMWRLQSGVTIDPNVSPADEPFVTFSNVRQAETERSQPAKAEGGTHHARASRS